MTALEATIAALNAFVPADDGKDVARLYEIFDGVEKVKGRERAMRPMFEFLERFPDADVGTPGPLVHELEAIDGYQSLLRESLHRRPTPTTVHMVNRILNSSLTKEERQSWLGELKAAAAHPAASSSAREEAAYYVDHQARKTGAV